MRNAVSTAFALVPSARSIHGWRYSGDIGLPDIGDAMQGNGALRAALTHKQQLRQASAFRRYATCMACTRSLNRFISGSRI